MDHHFCVVIETAPSDEERVLKYLSHKTHKSMYNWILKENDKIRVWVWWEKRIWKEFSSTPLRSFLKRLGKKSTYPITISHRMSTDAGVQRVCDHKSGSISEYHLESKLLWHLRGLLAGEAPGMADDGNQNVSDVVKMKHTIVTKLDLILKNIVNILTQLKRVPEDGEPTGEEPMSDEPTTSSEYPLPDTTSLPVREFF